MTETVELIEKISQALNIRSSFLLAMAANKTNCYRLFHGSVEGAMGLTIDRYGLNLLIQSFHVPLENDLLRKITDFYLLALPDLKHVFSHDRSKGTKQARQCIYGDFSSSNVTESGIQYYCDMEHAGQDPLLFLDFRHARDLIGQLAKDKTVLNTFSFSCGIGISAMANGARQVCNVDFASSALLAGEKSLNLNGLNRDHCKFIHEDYFLATRQMAGLSVPVRRGRGVKGLQRYAKQSFDLVVLDPPRWAKSKYGTVDLVRDYNSVLKPALLATKDTGQLFCTNNVAQVDREQWLEGVVRCCEKNKRSISDLQLIDVGEDFPSFDNKHPLKQALITFK